MTDKIQHLTASGYVLRHFPGGWRVLLIMHPRMQRLTVPGGHVEQPYESGPEAVQREIREEAGVEVTLLLPPAPRLPATFAHDLLPAPWWTVGMRAGADSVVGAPHIHLDQQYLAITSQDPSPERELDVYWLGTDDLRTREDCLPDTRGQALEILTALDGIEAAIAPEALARTLFQRMTAY